MNKRFHFKASVLAISLLAPSCSVVRAEQANFTNSGIETKIIEKVEEFIAITLFDKKTPDKVVTDCLASLAISNQQQMQTPNKMFKELFGQESFNFFKKINSLKKEMVEKFVGHLETIIIKKGNHQTSEIANKFGKSVNNFAQILDYYLYKTIYNYAKERKINVDSFSMSLPIEKKTQDAIENVLEKFIATDPSTEEVKATLIALGMVNIVQERHPEMASANQDMQSMTPATRQQIQQDTAGTMQALQELGKDGNKKIQSAIQAIIMGQMSDMLKGENIDSNSPQTQQMAMLLIAATTMQTMQTAYKTMYKKLEKSHKLACITFDVDGQTMNLPLPESIDKKDFPKPEDLAKKLQSIKQIIEL